MAFDPGPDLGWAQWDQWGEFRDSGIWRGLTKQFDELIYLQTVAYDPPEVWIVEDWTTDPRVKLGGSKMEVVQSIGALKYVAHYLPQTKLILQPRTILPVAEKIAGLKIAKGAAHKNSHDTAARCHGEYYLVSNGIKPHRLDKEL